VAVCEEDQGCVSVTIPANSAGRLDEPVDFLRRQVLAGSPFAVRAALRWSDIPNFPVFAFWRCRVSRRKCLSLAKTLPAAKRLIGRL
jgi:hypothetical protein